MSPNLLLALAGLRRRWLTGLRGGGGRGRVLGRSSAVLVGAFATVVLGAGTASAATLVVDGPAHGDVLAPVVLTPDGSRVLFLADHATDHKVELWSAPAAGGGATRVSPSMGPDADVYGFALTPDGSRVVYLADQRADEVLELFTAPSTGGASLPLHAALPGDRDVTRFGLTGDGLRVVFLADLAANQAFGLHTVPVVGGTPRNLTAGLPPWVDVDDDFMLTRDGTRAVFRADVGDGVHDLFSVRLDGRGEAVPLGADVFSEHGVEPDVVANRDVSVVTFRMEVEPGVFHRWAVPTDGSADAALVHPELPEGAAGAGAPAAVTNEGSSVVLVSDHDEPGRPSVWLAPTNGSAAPRLLSGRIADGGVVHEVALSADGSTAVYLAEQRAKGVSELFAARLDAVEPVRRVSRTMVRGGDVLAGFHVLPDASGVVYRADARRNGQVELFHSPLDRRSTARVLNTDLPDDGDVAAVDDGLDAFQVSWDGSEVLYLADATTDDDVDLYTVPTDGSGPAQMLNDHVAGRSVEDVTKMVARRVGFVTVDSATQSDEDLWTAATIAPPAPPDADARFGPDGAVVTWDEPEGDVVVDGYVVEVTPGGTTVEVDGDAVSVVIGDLEPGVTYVVTVRAVNDAGVSPEVTTDPGTVPGEGGDEPVVDPGGTPDSTVDRLSGRNRYATAARLSQAGYPQGADVVHLGTGTNFPDALSAGPVAAVADGPILLTDPRALSAETAAELVRLDPSEVVVLGGSGAVSGDVERAVGRLLDGVRVRRVAGSDRYDTAARLSTTAFEPGVAEVWLATGTNFPDALAAGAVAGARGAPILLTDPARLPAATADELRRLRPGRVFVLGGRGAVADGVVADVRAAVGGVDVRRLSGPDRYATAAAVTAMAMPGGTDHVHLATGTNFPDALAAGPLAARRAGAILLTDRAALPAPTRDELDRLSPGRVSLLGGEAAVAQSVAGEVSTIVP